MVCVRAEVSLLLIVSSMNLDLFMVPGCSVHLRMRIRILLLTRKGRQSNGTGTSGPPVLRRIFVELYSEGPRIPFRKF
jgi:hypothetical protein